MNIETSATEQAIAKTLANRELTKSSQVLIGIITGIVADGQLHDLEIQMLNTWLAENVAVARVWPGSAIAKQIREALADGFISPEERSNLLESLAQLVGSDFSETGSTTTNIPGLPFEKEAPIEIRGSGLCLTGQFVYGTRAKCEALTEKAGGIALPGVTNKVNYLVVGTHISPDWVSTSYGLKIQKAMTMKTKGHPIAIIHEQRWLDAMQNLCEI